MFDNVQRAVDFSQRNKGVDKMPSIAKKILLRKKFKKQLFSPFHRQKHRKPVVKCLQKESKKLKKTKFESELQKSVVSFLDCHGNYDSNLISLRMKSLKQTKLFCNS